jgi:hypothetical protein
MHALIRLTDVDSALAIEVEVERRASSHLEEIHHYCCSSKLLFFCTLKDYVAVIDRQPE